MKTDLHLTFPRGTCRDAFALYARVLRTKPMFVMTYGEAPPPSPVPAEDNDLIMHMSMPVGSMVLMGCDDALGTEAALGGFQISLSVNDEAEVKRVFAELSEGGKVIMEPQKTFWTPLFSMLTDKFGVSWMVSVPGPQPE